jgi:hypothetical protein
MTEDDNDFKTNLRDITSKKVAEVDELTQELKRLDYRIENTKQYIAELNNFIQREEANS